MKVNGSNSYSQQNQWNLQLMSWIAHFYAKMCKAGNHVTYLYLKYVFEFHLYTYNIWQCQYENCCNSSRQENVTQEGP